ncbi:hypothetical protein SAY86_021118 [Trapa natans]|uniref:Uncharacterized protein n=1 Tax=Trapa natans TaxID=22666 RepID=A0AAN7MTL1_TRANT|nr:hypothetical protein SAY86_021118 [Trapa natans]
MLKIWIEISLSLFFLGIGQQDQDLVELDSLDGLTLFGILLTMEILVVVAQHKHQYYSRISKSQDLARLNSSPPNKFRAIHCQTSHAADGFIPPPLRVASTPLVKQTPPSKKTPASPPASDPACMQPSQKSIPIPIIAKSICNEKFSDEGFFDGSLSFSERWAGPTYSNSPSPSSLPIPKFLQLPTSSHSLGFPNVVSHHDFSAHQISKSAPTSPTREFSLPPFSEDLFHSADYASITLRRILNLKPFDECHPS